MKQSSTNPGSIADHLIALGIGLAALYWILESAMDTFAFRMGNLAERMFAPDANELGILLLFSSYAQTTLDKRKRANEVLREQTAMFQGLFESAPDAILVVNREGHIVRVNRQAERMFGYIREALIGQSVAVLLPEHLREKHLEDCAGYFTEPCIHPIGAGSEVYGRRKDGSQFPVDIMLSHLETGEGTVVLSVVRDITEHKRADEALREYAERLRPDVLALDLMIPGLNGLEVTRQVSQRSPRTRVLILSMHANEAYVLEALRNGATGYVLKGAGAAELVQAVREVAAGRRYLSPPLSERAIEAYVQKAHTAPLDLYETLTTREREVLHLAAEGHSATEIADRLSIGPRTVETHRANLMRKLGLRTQTDLIRYALRRGILPREDDLPGAGE